MGSLCLCRWVTNVVRPPLSWWTLTSGPKGVADGLAAPWHHIQIDLGSYHNVIVLARATLCRWGGQGGGHSTSGPADPRRLDFIWILKDTERQWNPPACC